MCRKAWLNEMHSGLLSPGICSVKLTDRNRTHERLLPWLLHLHKTRRTREQARKLGLFNAEGRPLKQEGHVWWNTAAHLPPCAANSL